MQDEILLIDKDDSYAQALKVYLEREQFDVFIAGTQEDANRLYSSIHPAILFADIDSITSEYVQFIKTIKKQTSRTQIIVAAEAEFMDSLMEEIGSDALSYLIKPVKSGALDHALKLARHLNTANKRIDVYEKELKALRNTQNLYQQLFNEVPCYISVQDRKFRLTATNKLFKRDFGDEIGSHCFEIYKHRNSPCQDCPVAATFEDGLHHSTEEIVTSKSGKQYNVMTWTAPIRNTEGEITQVMEMSTNITQIRQLQDHLTSLGLMIGSMSHGVKGMLTALDGGIYQLETGLAKKDEDRINRAFEQVKQMSSRIRKMVLEILYYAKSRKLNYEVVDILQMAQKVLSASAPLAEKNNIQIEIDFSENMGKIDVDPNWMQAALVNFLENAVDACILDRNKTDHHVKFSVFEVKPHRICFIFQDNGIGMDKETKNKMFTLFFTSKGSQGTGLGLFIANRVITLHGGTIKVESQPQEGSFFEICLPRCRPENSRMVEFPPDKENHNEQSEEIQS